MVGFQITRTKGSSEVAVAEAARQTIAELSRAYPYVKIAEAFNTVQPVVDDYEGSMSLLYEGAFLAIVVVFIFFLHDWRATLVSVTGFAVVDYSHLFGNVPLRLYLKRLNLIVISASGWDFSR